jgi:hypothetical protein
MKTLKITAFEEKWLKNAIQEDIVSLEEWEDHPPPDGLNKKEREELKLLRKFAAEFSQR